MRTRRMLIGGSGLLALLLMAPRLAPSVRFDPGLGDLDPHKFPKTTQIWSWERKLAHYSPPFTGSRNHRKWLDFVESQIEDGAGIPVQRRTFTFPYWELQSYGITGPNGEPIPVAGYQPYSGQTSADGVEAQIWYAGTAPALDYSGAAGKIVVYEAPFNPFPLRTAWTSLGFYLPSDESDWPASDFSPQWEFLNAPSLNPARTAGALGVVRIWTQISDEAAQNQAQPFSSAPNTVPALWVGKSAGDRLKQIAATGGTVNFKLYATITPDTPTDNLWAILPGQTDETIIVNTHSDGCNALEENGPVGIIALARYFSKLPLSQRKRTLVFLMTTGHFGHGLVPGVQTWRTENADIMSRTVAAVTLEHMGGLEWKDDPAGVYGPTGKTAWGPSLTRLQSMADVYLQNAAAIGATRMTGQNPNAAYFGEGSGFAAAGIPTISFIGGPWYLFTAPPVGGEIDKLDRDRLQETIATLASCVQQLDGMTVEEIHGM